MKELIKIWIPFVGVYFLLTHKNQRCVELKKFGEFPDSEIYDIYCSVYHGCYIGFLFLLVCLL